LIPKFDENIKKYPNNENQPPDNEHGRKLKDVCCGLRGCEVVLTCTWKHVSEECSVSIVRAEDGRSMFPRKAGNHTQDRMTLQALLSSAP
jgi:hypothetical protein